VKVLEGQEEQNDVVVQTLDMNEGEDLDDDEFLIGDVDEVQ
jgi:hypothetical protein